MDKFFLFKPKFACLTFVEGHCHNVGFYSYKKPKGLHFDFINSFTHTIQYKTSIGYQINLGADSNPMHFIHFGLLQKGLF